jgi:hypothetical protein
MRLARTCNFAHVRRFPQSAVDQTRLQEFANLRRRVVRGQRSIRLFRRK